MSFSDIDSARQRRIILVLVWSLTAIACLPAVFHWMPPAPDTTSNHYLPIGFVYCLAAAICYGFYRVEARSLARPQAILLIFVIFLVTCISNHIHYFSVDDTSYFFGFPAVKWQIKMQELILQLAPSVLPHSYRFLPNSIVRWLELTGIGYEQARDLYRLIFGLILFYSIYKYARLYCSYLGALIALLLVAVIYPVSFENYAGQLTDPLSHLSLVLAFIFLEIEEFGFLLSTLLVGSLAKETVLAMAGYYLLFCRKQRNYLVKAVVLCVGCGAMYYGTRFFVLHGAMHYEQVSGVTLQHVATNWNNIQWQTPFLLTACALLPFLAIAWKDTPLVLKREALFLFPVLFISGLFSSWLKETRNFMPLVFVLAVVAGRALSSVPQTVPIAPAKPPKAATAKNKVRR